MAPGDNNCRFWVKLRFDGNAFWVMPIKRDDQIFYAIVDNDLVSMKLSFNDLVEFQSCDVITIDEKCPT